MPKDGEGGWSWRRECPRFSGEESEYKGWRSQVEDWLIVGAKDIEYPGLEIRMSLRGKALAVTEELDRNTLKEKEGQKIILDKLDKVYKKDTLMENYGKMKKYFKMERGSAEKMRNFVVRYEKAAYECSRALGKEMLEGEAKGFHVLEQANLTDNQKQMVLAAVGEEKLDYDKVSKNLLRIFEGLGVEDEKDQKEWWGSENYTDRSDREGYRPRGRLNRGRGGRNPMDRRGRVTVCVICGSEWHWARDCNRNFKNSTKTSNNEKRTLDNSREKEDKNKEERIYIGGVNEADEETWGKVDAILDSGCKTTVCGEL